MANGSSLFADAFCYSNRMEGFWKAGPYKNDIGANSHIEDFKYGLLPGYIPPKLEAGYGGKPNPAKRSIELFLVLSTFVAPGAPKLSPANRGFTDY